MDTIWQDFRYAARMLAKNPGFTAVAVLVLALGIGANIAMFALTNALLLKPIEARDPHELVALYGKHLTRPNTYREFSYPSFQDIRELNTTFASLMAHDMTIVGLAEGEVTRRVFAQAVSYDFFDTFGVHPFRGRFFSAEEEAPGSGIPVAVVSHEYWRGSGEDPDLVGKTIVVNGVALEIVGIAPRNFTGRTALLSPPLYVPLGLYDRLLNSMLDSEGRPLAARANHQLFLVGRLLPGLTMDAANEQLATLASRMREAYPEINADQTIVVGPLARLSVSTSPPDETGIAATSAILLAMTGIVLLLACINLANMLLARGAARRKELAIRAAIGGGRARILRQLLAEGLLLSALGGAAALAVASWVNALLAASMSELLALNGLSFDILMQARPDGRVLLATAFFCLLGTLLFALGPAWRQSRPDVMQELKEQGAEAGAASRRRGVLARGNLLVVGQMALSLVLLVSAGLFLRAAFEAARVDPGFDIDQGLIVEVDPGLIGYDEPSSRDLYRKLYERLGSIPGIESVSFAATVPFGSVSTGRSVRRAEDLPGPGDEEIATVSATSNVVGAEYFDALGVAITRGRSFTRAESEFDGGPGVAIVDELLAARLWPDQDPVGRRIGFGRQPSDRGGDELEVVGVVETVRDDLFPAAAQPHVYVPFGQHFQLGMNIHLGTATTSADARADLLRAVRREIRALDDRLPILTLRTLRAHIEASASLWIVRLGATIFSTFGALALFLAVIGVYGVKAYTVARRTREIGIRKALGATSRATLWLIVREGMILAAVGLAIGLVLAAAVARLLASMLYQVGALDPLAFVGAPAVLAAAALVATWIPARRAARVAPIVALRQ